MANACGTIPPDPAVITLVSESLLKRFDTDLHRAALSRARSYGLPQDFVEDLKQGARVALLRSSIRYAEVSEPLARTIISNSVATSASTEKKYASSVLLSEPDEFDDDGTDGNRNIGVYAISDESTRPDAQGDIFLISQVRLAISELAIPFQRTYEALYVEGLTQRELADELSVSQPRVAKLHQQLLQQVRTRLTH